MNQYFNKCLFPDYFAADWSAASWVGHSEASLLKGSQATLVAMGLGLSEILKGVRPFLYYQHPQHNFTEHIPLESSVALWSAALLEPGGVGVNGASASFRHN